MRDELNEEMKNNRKEQGVYNFCVNEDELPRLADFRKRMVCTNGCDGENRCEMPLALYEGSGGQALCERDGRNEPPDSREHASILLALARRSGLRRVTSSSQLRRGASFARPDASRATCEHHFTALREELMSTRRAVILVRRFAAFASI